MDIQEINLRRSDFEAMHPIAKLFNFDCEKLIYFGDAYDDAKRLNDLWSTWCACVGLLYLETSTAKAQAVPEQVLKNHCMVGQTWFMEGTPVSALIRHAESVYKAEVIAQNSKIEFGTDDNEHWFAHDVPFYGTVQIDRIEEHGLVEWDIHFNGCWQGPFGSKSECIKHLEGCIAEEHEEAQEPAND